MTAPDDTDVEQDPPGLFDEPERADGGPHPDQRTPGERRRSRHLAAIARGQHPLALALGYPLQLHRDAPRDGRREPDGTPRCGGCLHRRTVGHHSRSYPKCLAEAYTASRPAWPHELGPRAAHVRADDRVEFTAYPRASHGPGTDVAAWWPGCSDWTAAAGPSPDPDPEGTP